MPDIFISDKKEKVVELPKGAVEEGGVIPTQSYGPFSSFCFYPDHVDFETREKEEKVILMVRQHIIVNLKWIIISVLMLLVPTVAKFFNVFDSLPSGYEFVITLIWYMITFAYAMENFISWFFNVYIVTNIRVVDVDFNNLIYKQVSDANLTKIQDVTYNMGGVARTIFNYGNVFIQTAAEVSEFDFLAVPFPDKVAKIIQDLMTNKEK